MVFTIHRYIFRDLLKTFCLATVVLSTMLGLGVMLRPLRQFNVDPAAVPQLILCTLPITLTMVLPIAALLAATLNYGRLAAANEINACRSSGIGLLTLIYPALTLALLVGIATLLLAFHVIPAYAEKFEAIITAEAEAIAFRSIEKNGYLGNIFPDVLIHADRAWPEQHILEGVVVARLDGYDIQSIFAAQRVEVHFQTAGPENQVRLHLSQATVIDNETGASADVGDYVMAIPVPSMWRDNIKFKKLKELKAIEKDMTLFVPVRQALNEVRQQLTVETFFQWTDQQLRQNGFVDLFGPTGRLRLFGQACRRKDSNVALARKNRTALIAGQPDQTWPVNLDHYLPNNNRPDRQYQARRAQLTVDPGTGAPGTTPPAATILLGELQWSLPANINNLPDQPDMIRLDEYDFRRLALPAQTVAQAQTVSLPQVLARRLPLNVPASTYLLGLYDNLIEDCRQLATAIKVESHSRLAFGVSCVVLVLLGAALGIRFQSGNLLTAFGVSFIPAALCLIAIFTGKHIAEHSSVGNTAGIMFLWSGIVLVALANTVAYKLLLKH